MTTQELHRVMDRFAEWLYYNTKVFPDGWHYKGVAYSTKEIRNIFLKEIGHDV